RENGIILLHCRATTILPATNDQVSMAHYNNVGNNPSNQNGNMSMKIARLALMGGLLATALSTGSATARDLTVVSWGGNYQDAQREIYFKPFSEKVGKPLLDESWDGGYGVVQAKVKAGK